jgi:hypothetical protein
MDGIPVFCEQSWGAIRESKQLNLPGARQLVADFRCNEFKTEALEHIEPKIATL